MHNEPLHQVRRSVMRRNPKAQGFPMATMQAEKNYRMGEGKNLLSEPTVNHAVKVHGGQDW
jgi:hypothetical protein